MSSDLKLIVIVAIGVWVANYVGNHFVSATGA